LASTSEASRDALFRRNPSVPILERSVRIIPFQILNVGKSCNFAGAVG
jgi:hypothetical protein